MTVLWGFEHSIMEACAGVFLCPSKVCKSAEGGLKRIAFNECIQQTPRIMTNPEHRLVPGCYASRLNVKMW